MRLIAEVRRHCDKTSIEVRLLQANVHPLQATDKETRCEIPSSLVVILCQVFLVH